MTWTGSGENDDADWGVVIKVGRRVGGQCSLMHCREGTTGLAGRGQKLGLGLGLGLLLGLGLGYGKGCG